MGRRPGLGKETSTSSGFPVKAHTSRLSVDRACNSILRRKTRTKDARTQCHALLSTWHATWKGRDICITQPQHLGAGAHDSPLANTLLIIQTQWSLVAVTHTHTPLRTARPPAAPPRRERDEEMRQQRRSTGTYGRVQLCATLPGVSHFPGQPRPFEAGK